MSSVYKGVCFSSARMALFSETPYFSNKSVGTLAEMSSNGLHMP